MELRHNNGDGGPGNLDAHIEESRICGVVLDQDEIKNLKRGYSFSESLWKNGNGLGNGENEIELATIECDSATIRFSKLKKQGYKVSLLF